MSDETVHTNLVDLHARAVRPATIRVEGGRIAAIQPLAGGAEARGFALPGFVDAHVHVESSMLTPANFAAAAVVHGTVASVSDPHEIANVLGVEGVRWMLDNAGSSPFRFAFGAPSCVPATAFETAGAALSVADVTGLLDDDRIFYLSEVMNFPGVLGGDPDLLAMIAAAEQRGKPVDGHAPGLRGEDARAYLRRGIATDHECFTLEEAEDKLALSGTKVLIREGSAARNFDALWPLIDRFPGRVMFCSDDKHPDQLRPPAEGGWHINRLCARAVANGCDVFHTLRAACVTPVEHYGLPVGLLRVGDPADFVIVEDLAGFAVTRTLLGGVEVAAGGVSRISPPLATAPNRFAAEPVDAAAFAVPAAGGATVAAIVPEDGQLVTGRRDVAATVRSGAAVSDPGRGLLKLAVVNRYTPGVAPAVCFVEGFGLTRGAIAGSVAHDSHNVLVVGADDEAMAAAVNAVVAERGGLAAADGSRVEVLPLPVAGLMSLAAVDEVAGRYLELDAMARAMGSTLQAPFMTLSFMALLVIPALKLSDRGLFDGTRFSFTESVTA
ncbi:adenine deaminase [Phycisphaera mikurensis]|uniref:Adenine deaminase n=1 Tax=Phycisphaera mikurensis (strain NBRC 102666 / KCTC 22515 / FYK2301M01) TaxID=1142394 RepID=I0IIX5_PHYMF|nr:adenine deaminase [Phycisphaera mikurensis]MBB6443402.1 adenine deaminase [Phycisphaera mikurensis]BAM05213.1 adenine deaminase [Phycisphaera mikurensis NBRC 102666]